MRHTGIFIDTEEIVLKVRFYLKNPSPLLLAPATLSNITTPITFPGPYPNSNLRKLRELALYAKDRTDWEPFTKALIYGCYMHVIQDHFAGMVFQPTRFGYGYAVEAETVRHNPILSFPELFYEALYTPTYIPNWRFVSRDLYRALYQGGHLFSFGGSCDFMPAHDYATFQYQTSWQDTCFPWVQQLILTPLARFILACDVKDYKNSSLTLDRLRAYMHAWAIFFFLTHGYYANLDSIPPYAGGIYAHPNWTPDSIINFWSGIIEREVENDVEVWLKDSRGRLRRADFLLRDPFYGPIIWGIVKAILGNIADDVFHRELRKTLRDRILPYALDNVQEQLPWPKYFETPRDFSRLNDSIKSLPVFQKIGKEIEVWEQWSRIKLPNRRSSYSEEISMVSDPFKELFKAYLHQGESYLNANWTLSRKAGLTGGMYEPPSGNYGRQPGILFMGFKKGRDTVWSNINLYRNGDLQDVKLIYDLIAFGGTNVVVKGQKGNGEIVRLNSRGLRTLEPCRFRDSIILDGTMLANNDIRILWFEIETGDNSENYTVMLSSKYDDVYLS